MQHILTNTLGSSAAIGAFDGSIAGAEVFRTAPRFHAGAMKRLFRAMGGPSGAPAYIERPDNRRAPKKPAPTVPVLQC